MLHTFLYKTVGDELLERDVCLRGKFLELYQKSTQKAGFSLLGQQYYWSEFESYPYR